MSSPAAVALLLVFGQAQAGAQEPRWSHLASTASGSAWSVYSGIIRRPTGEVGIWIKIDHSHDEAERARETQGLLLFRCDERRYRWESLVAYAANGQAMPMRWPRETAADNVAPDSIIDVAWEWACQ